MGERTALMAASARGHIDIVKYLTEKGANINKANSVSSYFFPLDNLTHTISTLGIMFFVNYYYYFIEPLLLRMVTQP